MFGQTLTIARNTFVESVRQPIYFILIAICGLLQVFNTWGTNFSMGMSSSAEVSSDNKLLLDVGLATVFVCGTLLAAFVATAVLSREIENKTVLTVVSKPVARPVVVLGKYLGAAGAMLIAIVTMLLFLQLGIRHGVMTTTAEALDVPVILFSLIAVVIAFGVATWCNFFYGWVFPQTASLLLMPLMLAAWVGVLFVNKDWQIQDLHTDFKPQITLASLCVLMALLVLTAVATAASARLGQVMTIVVCSGVFLFGLLSNHLVGRHTYDNEFVARIQEAIPDRPDAPGFSEPGSTMRIVTQLEPTKPVQTGMPFYYGPNPNGFPLYVASFKPFDGNLAERREVLNPDDPPSLVVTASDGKELTVRRAGGSGRLFTQPPASGDYVFTRPTKVNPVALGVWGIIPNIQFFWLVDAVTQNQPIPAGHVLLVAAYAVIQIAVFLSLAVLLFQRREVG
jgi:ABC-2 type transport system permease protein